LDVVLARPTHLTDVPNQANDSLVNEGGQNVLVAHRISKNRPWEEESEIKVFEKTFHPRITSRTRHAPSAGPKAGEKESMGVANDKSPKSAKKKRQGSAERA